MIFNAFAPKTWIAFVVCGIADTILALFMFFGSKRTKAGNQVYGQILGFKEFIKKAELDRLKMLVEENPSYYYDIMPYAYVLGLSDQWIENFETMHMPEPDWYSGRDPFGDAVFVLQMRAQLHQKQVVEAVPAAASQEVASQEAVPAVAVAAPGSCWRQIILHVCVCFKEE